MKDTRDLFEEREDLKATILADHNAEFPRNEKDDFDDINFDNDYVESWAEDWKDELEKIEEIDTLEREVGSEFEYGETLIEEDEFEDYCRDLIEECGYISKDFPSWIEVDWGRTTDNMRVDYSEVVYLGTDYLFRI